MNEEVLEQISKDSEDDFAPVVLGEDESSAVEEIAEAVPETPEVLEPPTEEKQPKEPFKIEAWEKLKESCSKNKKKITVSTVCTVLVLLVVYCIGVFYYTNHFFMGTTINGFNCSNLTVEQATEKLKADIASYEYVLKERNNKTEIITGEELAMKLESIGDVNEQKANQNPYKWCFDFASRKQTINIIVTLDEAILANKVSSLECVKETEQEMVGATNLIRYSPDTMTFSVDEGKEAEADGRAGLSLKYNTPIFPGQKFYGQPNFGKNIVSVSKLTEVIKKGMYALLPELDLEKEQCYVAMTEENNLKQALETLNKYVGTKVQYVRGEEIIPLDCGSISHWLAIDENYSIFLDEDQVAGFVKGLADKYNTIGKARTLVTSFGDTITVSGGDYGWKVDIEEETEALCNIIRNGEQTSREPIYEKKAASHGSIDVGNTYVEINIGSQKLWFYKDGEKIITSDIVSGNPYAGNATPKGIYKLKYKERNATLVGEDYRTPVDFWMPFNGGVGMHDATWRGAFGGSIYLGGGSHGCINLPYSIAQKIYANISPGDPVIVY